MCYTENMLLLHDFTVTRDSQRIVSVPSLILNSGELHRLSAPNGTGKSSLASAIMGHPDFATQGTLLLNDVAFGTNVPLEERARMGLFVSYQHPIAIPGLSVYTYFLEVCRAQGIVFATEQEFDAALIQALESVGLSGATKDRFLYEGFSGGERKRLELAHLLMLKPRVAILDEIDSGLDSDGVDRTVAIIDRVLAAGTAVLMITHNSTLMKNQAKACWTIRDNQLRAE